MRIYDPSPYYVPAGLTGGLDSGTVQDMAKAEVIEYTDTFEPRGSTSITQVWWNENTERLTVSFISGGLYSYEGVSADLYSDFFTAESKGQFFRENFRVPGQVWPGAKHDEHLAKFQQVDSKPKMVEPDLDALKVEKLTSGHGKIFKLHFEFSGESDVEVRAADLDEALRVFNDYFADTGFKVKVKGVYIDFTVRR